VWPWQLGVFLLRAVECWNMAADKRDELFRNVPKDLFGSAADTNLEDGKVVVDERGYKFVLHT